MSKSIWHKKHVFVVDRNGQVVVKLDDGTYDFIWVWKDKTLQDVVVFSENGIKFIEEYCYLDDLIAQADKAERLQKAVDIALFRLENILMDEEIKIRKRCPLATSYLEYDIERIKQLIKGE